MKDVLNQNHFLQDFYTNMHTFLFRHLTLIFLFLHNLLYVQISFQRFLSLSYSLFSETPLETLSKTLKMLIFKAETPKHLFSDIYLIYIYTKKTRTFFLTLYKVYILLFRCFYIIIY